MNENKDLLKYMLIMFFCFSITMYGLILEKSTKILTNFDKIYISLIPISAICTIGLMIGIFMVLYTIYLKKYEYKKLK